MRGTWYASGKRVSSLTTVITPCHSEWAPPLLKDTHRVRAGLPFLVNRGCALGVSRRGLFGLQRLAVRGEPIHGVAAILLINVLIRASGNHLPIRLLPDRHGSRRVSFVRYHR